jgi:hypothetical protein
MTPKEKALEIVQRFGRVIPFQDTYYSEEELYKMHKKDAKQCALICVGEIISNSIEGDNNIDFYWFQDEIKWWNEVKQEINKL